MSNNALSKSFRTLVILWLSVAVLVLLLGSFDAIDRDSLRIDSVVVPTLIGSMLFVVVLVLVRFLSNRFDFHSRLVNPRLEEITIARDDDGNIYLLPCNSSEIIHIKCLDGVTTVDKLEGLLPANLKSLDTCILKTDARGRLSLSQSVHRFRVKTGVSGQFRHLARLDESTT